MEYYLQDTRKYCGNAMFWWNKGGAGYSCDIEKAEVFTKEDARLRVEKGMGKYTAWPKPLIDKHLTKMVDMQDIDSNGMLYKDGKVFDYECQYCCNTGVTHGKPCSVCEDQGGQDV